MTLSKEKIAKLKKAIKGRRDAKKIPNFLERRKSKVKRQKKKSMFV